MAINVLRKQDFSRRNIQLPDVPGLPEPYLSSLEEVIGVFQQKLSRNILRGRYYDQKNSLKDLGISIPPPLANNSEFTAVVEWAEKAVSALQCRSRFDGFVGDGAEVVNKIFADNVFSRKYPMLTTSELTHSVAFAAIGRGKTKPVQIFLYSACNAAAVWDYENDCVKTGITVTSVDSLNNPTGYNLFTKDAIVVLTKPEPKQNRWAYEIMPHNMGKPLFVAFVNNPSLDRPFGKSRISRAVMSAIDEAVRECCRISIASEFAALPQKWIMGADDDLLDGIPEWQAYMGAILAISRDENNELPQVGQFAQVDVQQHVQLMKLCASRMSSASDIPVHLLGVVSESNPQSAEAIEATTNELVIKAQNLNSNNADSLKELAEMAVAIYNNTSPNTLTDTDLDFQAHFLNPSYPSVLSQADGMSKMISALPFLAETEVALEAFGFDKTDIQRIMSDKRKSQATNIIKSLNMVAGGNNAE